MPHHHDLFHVRPVMRKVVGIFVLVSVPIVTDARESSPHFAQADLGMGAMSMAAVLCLGLATAAILFPWE